MLVESRRGALSLRPPNDGFGRCDLNNRPVMDDLRAAAKRYQSACGSILWSRRQVARSDDLS